MLVLEKRNSSDLAVGVEIMLAWGFSEDPTNNTLVDILTGRAAQIADGSKRFNIRFFSNGEIKVRGAILGSANLSLKQWGSSPEVVKRTLERAYNHPQIFHA